ncbi:hypothetical protein CVA01_07200 [Corynebacterium variabile]|uniref:Uncharacterized protein n=1 Tax=Corynebacterium variabile TaxID=1727 RepID=A0A4Y4BZX2_9CORY|nr:hypothetical protein CVA01_07200 [Corynebacterium variabile]
MSLPDCAGIARVDIEMPLGQQHRIGPEFCAVCQTRRPDAAVRRGDVLRAVRCSVTVMPGWVAGSVSTATARSKASRR